MLITCYKFQSVAADLLTTSDSNIAAAAAAAKPQPPPPQVGCTGGGSNFGGLAFPVIREKLAGHMNPVIRAVEPAACPSLTKGKYTYDYGDTAGRAIVYLLCCYLFTTVYCCDA